ncbi:hypothetical protein WNB94_00575 [Aquabacterium sp. A3]|uniref:hypothetical protein n=1 Tax=Aquabacterium sp. A3 TaxID=3132829 RepID=UPI00311A44C8
MPRQIPGFRAITEDLGATPRDIARSLDVGLSTAYRWLQNDQAPRMACLSLFWLTRWGLSQVDAELFNLHQVHAGHADALQRRVRELESQLLAMRLSHFTETIERVDPELIKRIEHVALPAWFDIETERVGNGKESREMVLDIRPAEHQNLKAGQALTR